MLLLQETTRINAPFVFAMSKVKNFWRELRDTNVNIELSLEDKEDHT